MVAGGTKSVHKSKKGRLNKKDASVQYYSVDPLSLCSVLTLHVITGITQTNHQYQLIENDREVGNQMYCSGLLLGNMRQWTWSPSAAACDLFFFLKSGAFLFVCFFSSHACTYGTDQLSEMLVVHWGVWLRLLKKMLDVDRPVYIKI
jgi:hypothetical protein